MRSYVLLGCMIALTVVSTVGASEGYHRFLNAVPADVQKKCYEEADLVADKDKVLKDESMVDPDKLSVYSACVLKTTGAMTDGKISEESLSKQVDVLFANDPTLNTRKQLVKECIEKATGNTDAEKVKMLANCVTAGEKEKGI